MAEFLQDNLRVFVVPVEIMDTPDLDIYEQMVYIVLRSFANPREATAFPSYNTIAKLGRMSRRKAIDSVASLVEKGLLKKEVRLDVTKNRKIRNTSNLYTIESPQVVHSVHQGSAQRAPRVVHSVHQGSAQRAPEHKQLTKTIKTISMNNNNTTNDDVVAQHFHNLKARLTQKGISINDTILLKWMSLNTEENILRAIEETFNRQDIKNPIGYITRMLELGFTPTKRKELPMYIVNQGKKESLKESINLTQQKEVLDLLLQLGEINQEDYENQIKEWKILSNK